MGPLPTKEEQQPIVIIIFNGVQHVFIEADVAEAESFKLSHLTSTSVVPQTIRELAPTRVHILAASLFFGPISHFMHMLQKEFGIERDVSLEFESLALAVPINMSFATTSLSLAHIFAISTAHATNVENVVPILVANLVVETTNFVKQYNELVHNFKSKRSFHISGSPKKKVPYNYQDDNTSVHSTHSTQSMASSTWSQLAVRDSASVAGAGDLETPRIDEWDTSNHRSSSFRLGLRSSFNEFKINSPSSRDPCLTFSEDNDALSVRSLDPIHSSSSRPSSHSKSFAYPLDRSTTTPTPPSSLSRKRPRGALPEGSSEMLSEDEDPPTSQSLVKRPKMLGNQPLTSSSGIQSR